MLKIFSLIKLLDFVFLSTYFVDIQKTSVFERSISIEKNEFYRNTIVNNNSFLTDTLKHLINTWTLVGIKEGSRSDYANVKSFYKIIFYDDECYKIKTKEGAKSGTWQLIGSTIILKSNIGDITGYVIKNISSNQLIIYKQGRHGYLYFKYFKDEK